MNWVTSLIRRAWKLTAGPPRDPALVSILGEPPVGAGVMVNEDIALNYSAVWCAVRVLSEPVGVLPLWVYRRRPGGRKELAYGHPNYQLLDVAPSKNATPLVFKETLQGHTCTWGNGYAEIERAGSGRAVALHCLTPDRVSPKLVDGEIVYEVRRSHGPPDTVPATDMLHVPGLGWDGLKGYSVIRKARESIGMGLGTEQYGARFFGNGARPGGVLEHPGKLGPEPAKRLRLDWDAMHGGPMGAHKIAVLEEGMKYQQIGIPPEDAQFLETRKFQITEVARWFRVPPHMLADLERATFSNIEHLSLDFVRFSLMRWLVGWEQEIQRKLFLPSEQGEYFVRFWVDALQRGDQKTRYESYAIGRQWGWLSADDIRAAEDMDPLPDNQGDVYLAPLNMVPASQAGGVKPEPAPPAGTKPEPSPPGASDPQDQGKAARELLRLRVADVLERMVRREASAARRAAKKPERFLRWLDEFYPRSEAVVRDAIEPAAAAFNAAGGDADAASIAHRWIAASRNALLELSGTCRATELGSAVDRELEAWHDRPAETVAAELAPD